MVWFMFVYLTLCSMDFNTCNPELRPILIFFGTFFKICSVDTTSNKNEMNKWWGLLSRHNRLYNRLVVYYLFLHYIIAWLFSVNDYFLVVSWHKIQYSESAVPSTGKIGHTGEQGNPCWKPTCRIIFLTSIWHLYIFIVLKKIMPKPQLKKVKKQEKNK